ncbi:hypothetical protein [Vibrio aquimaris]|uniref:Uncharacterized protein n=1 Tax=Vibrio aquimaris TaxID=2587862 RepID=A0A5P9CKM1_9VIBR|nr:hypothetical protein [Vibrio aquimaris]QFT26551.1 hypothetical protein FIV01_08935 [Vibrio aquimaris]
MTTYKLLTDDSASKALLSNTNIYNWETRTDADTENPENRDDDTIKDGTGYVDTLASTISLIANSMGFTRKETTTQSTFHAFPITFVNNTKSVIMTSIAATGDTDNTVISDRPGVILPKAQADVVIESALDTDDDGESTNSTSIWFDVWGVKTDTSLTTSGDVDWGWRIKVERSAYSAKHARSTLRVVDIVRLGNGGGVGNGANQGRYVYDESTTGQFNIYGADEPEESGLPLVAFSCPEYMSEHNRGEFVITLLEHSIPLSTSEQPPKLPSVNNPAIDPSGTHTLVLKNDTTDDLSYSISYTGSLYKPYVLQPTESLILDVIKSADKYDVMHEGDVIRALDFDNGNQESPDIIYFPEVNGTQGLIEYKGEENVTLPVLDLTLGLSYGPIIDTNGIDGNMLNNTLWVGYLEDNVATIVVSDKTPPTEEPNELPELPAGATWVNPAADPSKTSVIVIRNDTPNSVPLSSTYVGTNGFANDILIPGETLSLSIDESDKIWRDSMQVKTIRCAEIEKINFYPWTGESGVIEFGSDEVGYKPMLDLNTGISGGVVSFEYGVNYGDHVDYFSSCLWTYYEQENVAIMSIQEPQ